LKMGLRRTGLTSVLEVCKPLRAAEAKRRNPVKRYIPLIKCERA
jgi:hypothetical protein